MGKFRSETPARVPGTSHRGHRYRHPRQSRPSGWPNIVRRRRTCTDKRALIDFECERSAVGIGYRAGGGRERVPVGHRGPQSQRARPRTAGAARRRCGSVAPHAHVADRDVAAQVVVDEPRAKGGRQLDAAARGQIAHEREERGPAFGAGGGADRVARDRCRLRDRGARRRCGEHHDPRGPRERPRERDAMVSAASNLTPSSRPGRSRRRGAPRSRSTSW